MPSVLRQWVVDLSLREQGSLIVAVRGCDLTPKFPLQSPERILVSFLRYLICNPADQREVDSEPGCFMITYEKAIQVLGENCEKFKMSCFGHYPEHWVTHIFQAYEILGYQYPCEDIRKYCEKIYLKYVYGLHLNPETKEQMLIRLTEDRVALGNIVS